MPYVCCDGNRYIGEHNCGRYHYGDQALVRECCVADYRAKREQVERVALTRWHPAAQIERAAYESLTIAEADLVGPGWRERFEY